MADILRYTELCNPYAVDLEVPVRRVDGDTWTLFLPARSSTYVEGEVAQAGEPYPTYRRTEKVAEELTAALLSKQERAELATYGYVTVASRLKKGVTYHVYPGMRTVSLFRRGQMIATACLVPYDDLPPVDYLFLRLLFLEGDEHAFVRQATFFPNPRKDGRARRGLDWIRFYQTHTSL